MSNLERRTQSVLQQTADTIVATRGIPETVRGDLHRQRNEMDRYHQDHSDWKVMSAARSRR
jgi:hypothetical protein